MLQSVHHGSPRTGSRLRWAGAATAGVVVGLGVFVLRQAGWLYGWQALVLAAALVIAIPSAKSLSGRIAANGVTVIGLSIFGWAFVSDINRATVVLAVAAGALVAWTGLRVDRARRLLPEVRWVDAWPLAGALATAYMAAPWFRVTVPAGALTMMQGGWDNVSHFDIFEVIRSTGGTPATLGLSPDGSRWAFVEYPAGFHTFAAGLGDLFWGRRVSASEDLLIFAHIVGLTLILATLVLLATVCATPAARRHPLRTGIAACAVSAVLLLSTFGTLASAGLINFILAACLAAAVVTMAANVRRLHTPSLLLPIAAGLIGVANGWILLLAFAGPAVALVLFPATRERLRGTRREWTIFGMIAVLLLGGVAYALYVVRNLTATGVLSAAGGTPMPPMGTTLALSTLVVAATLWTIGRHRRVPDADLATTRVVLTLGAAVAFAILVAGGLAVLQITSNGTLSYYFWKFAFALLLLAAVALAVIWIATPWTAPPTSRLIRITATILVCLGVTQIFGLAAPRLPYAGLTAEAPGWVARAELADHANHPSTSATATLDLLNSVKIGAKEYPYLVLSDEDSPIHSTLAAQWFLALSGHWSAAANEGLVEFPMVGQWHETDYPQLGEFLRDNPQRILVADDATGEKIANAVDDPELLSRIRTP